MVPTPPIVAANLQRALAAAGGCPKRFLKCLGSPGRQPMQDKVITMAAGEPVHRPDQIYKLARDYGWRLCEPDCHIPASITPEPEPEPEPARSKSSGALRADRHRRGVGDDFDPAAAWTSLSIPARRYVTALGILLGPDVRAGLPPLPELDASYRHHAFALWCLAIKRGERADQVEHYIDTVRAAGELELAVEARHVMHTVAQLMQRYGNPHATDDEALAA